MADDLRNGAGSIIGQIIVKKQAGLDVQRRGDRHQQLKAWIVEAALDVRDRLNGPMAARGELLLADPKLWRPLGSGRTPLRHGSAVALARLGRFLEKVVAQCDVGFAPMEEISRHVRSEIDAGRYTPRTELIPQYVEPVGWPAKPAPGR